MILLLFVQYKKILINTNNYYIMSRQFIRFGGNLLDISEIIDIRLEKTFFSNKPIIKINKVCYPVFSSKIYENWNDAKKDYHEMCKLVNVIKDYN